MALQSPAWSFSGGGGEDDEDESVSPELVQQLVAELGAVPVAALQPAKEHDFEKDRDENFHVDFLVSTREELHVYVSAAASL